MFVTLFHVAVLLIFTLPFALLTVVSPNESIDRQLGQELLRLLNFYKIPVKVAAPMMGLDESALRKQLRGDPGHKIHLSRVIDLGFQVFAGFVSASVYIATQHHVIEVADSINLRREA